MTKWFRLLTRIRTSINSYEGNFEDILERTTEGFFSLDRKFRMTYANPVTRDFVALSGREVIGKTMTELFPSPDRLKFMAHYERIRETGIPERFQEIYEGRVLAVDAHRTKDSGLAIFYRDITEEVERDRKLRESEERFRRLSDTIPHVIWMAAPRGEITYANQRWYDLTGFTKEETLGQGWGNALHPDDLAATVEKWQHAIAHQEIIEVSYRIRTRSGAYRYQLVKGVPIFDEKDTLLYWLGTITDIQDYVETQEKLHSTRSQLELITDAIPSFISYVRASDVTYQFVNHAYEEFFRVSKADIEGKTVAEILGPHVDVSQSPLGKALAGERLMYRTTLKHSVTNEERILDVHYIPDIRPTGEPGGIVVLGNDVTELVRALRDRDLFLSTASHELKTPLTAMLLQTQIQNRRDGGTQYSLFMEKHTRRLSVLVDDMLDVSRIRTGKIALELRTFDLSAVVREVVSELHDERFHISVANAVMITADEHRVEQVLMNLLTNAQKYGGTGPVHIEVRTSEDSAFVIVDDSGPGIPEEARNKIFGVYERGEGTNGIQGLGLGLFIAKSLMDNMGGKLELEPKFPGARFRMTFPLHRT